MQIYFDTLQYINKSYKNNYKLYQYFFLKLKKDRRLILNYNCKTYIISLYFFRKIKALRVLTLSRLIPIKINFIKFRFS